MASYILYEQKRKTGETKESLITAAAAKLIEAELRDFDKMNKVYPTFNQLYDIEDQKEWVPESQQLLLSYLIPSELKQGIIIIFCYFFFLFLFFLIFYFLFFYFCFVFLNSI